MIDRAKRTGGIGRALVLGGVLATAAVAGVGAPAAAQDVERESRGSCSGTSRWELSLEKEFGRIEVDLEVDTTRRGRAWTVVLRQNGTKFADIRRVTDGEGEIDLDRVRGNQPGTDTFRFRAVDQVNGEVCTGTLSI